jgi:hypothetical protein
VKVTEVVALPVKSYDAGKVMTIVCPVEEAPVGVVKRIVCDEVALIERDDIVSERPVRAAASAGLTGKILTITSAITRNRLRGLDRT